MHIYEICHKKIIKKIRFKKIHPSTPYKLHIWFKTVTVIGGWYLILETFRAVCKKTFNKNINVIYHIY